jgi:hypothetical protein
MPEKTITSLIADATTQTAQSIAVAALSPGYFMLHGLPVVIENPKGSTRSGVAKDGTPWSTTMTAHYGYIARTKDGTADREHHDVFVGENPESTVVFIIDQIDPDSGLFDEHKSVLGVLTKQEAYDLYHANYQPGWKGFGGIAVMNYPQFKEFLVDKTRSAQPAALNWRNGADDIDPECPDCNAVFEWEPNGSDGKGKCNRCGSSNPPAMPTGKRLADLKAKNIAQVDCLVADSADYTLLSDSGGLLKVRQLATIADQVNGNDRLYPRAVLEKTIAIANQRARSGAMLSELRHPSVAIADGVEKYVDNGPDAKTARVDSWEMLSDGTVWITRTMLDTEVGRARAQLYRAGKPVGISIRWKMRGSTKRMGGRNIFVADALDTLTVDDVDNPAVQETRHSYQLLSDSQRADLGLPAQDNNRQPASSGGKTGNPGKVNRMNERLQKAVNALTMAIMDNAPVSEKQRALNIVRHEAKLAADANEDITPVMKALADMGVGIGAQQNIPGYRTDAPGPEGWSAAFSAYPADRGWGGDTEANMQQQAKPGVKNPDDDAPSDKIGQTNMTDESKLTPEQKFVRNMMAQQNKAEADAKRESSVRAAIEANRGTILKGLKPDEAKFISDTVMKTAQDAASVPGLLQAQADAYGELAAKQRLAGGGYNIGGGNGTTVTPNNGMGTGSNGNGSGVAYDTGGRAPEWMAGVDSILDATDDYRKRSSGFDATASDVVKLRKWNRENFINPLIEDTAKRHKNSKSVTEWFAKEDSLMTGGEKALVDSMGQWSAAGDQTLTTNMYNQPTILTALLIQSFQDMQMLQFVDGFGPGLDMGAGGWAPNTNGIGSVLRVPVEYYAAPSGYGLIDGTFDAGLLVPENLGIPEAQVLTTWLPFAPAWRRVAVSLTRDVIKTMGNGPLNYPAVARHLYHMAYDKSRRIDTALGNEISAISDEYGATVVSSETVNLANNTSYLAGGSVTVNLNPTKLASASVAATDPFVTYGANVVGAIRLKTSGLGTASPYVGTTTTVVPIVRPRVTVDLTAAGVPTSTTKNPITFSTPASGVIFGYITSAGQVANIPGVAGTANCAVDYENGVIVVTSAFTSLTGAAGVITAPAIALSAYSYVTNFDAFIVNNPTLATGETLQMYYNRLLGQFDVTAAKMGMPPRFMSPNLALMSLNVSAYITQATAFFKLNSPDGTNLFPTDNYFFERTGIKGARVNLPWQFGDKRIVLTRKGSTKYAIDTPFEVRGPYPKYDASGNVIAVDLYYGEENSVIGTPQVQDQSGVVLNPVSRTIKIV